MPLLANLASVIVGLFPTLGFNQVATDNQQISRLDRAVHAAATDFFKLPAHVGLSIAVYDGGKISYYNYGTTSVVATHLPSNKSIYEIGSITKTFTGILASKALLDGKMTLDGDFRTYLKGRYSNLEMNGKPITLRTLADHTSGLPKDIPDSDALFQHPDFDKLPYQLIARERNYDTPRYLRDLHATKLASEPGATRTYSNIGVKLISFGLENVYGQPFDGLLKNVVTAPLGMPHTGLSVSRSDRPRLVQGYSPTGKPMPYHLANAGAAGGIYSSSEDLIKYAAWQLIASDPAVRKSQELISGDARTFGSGLIWDETTTPDGERKLWHSGGMYGMSSQLILFPDARVGFVLLANDGGFNTQGELDALAMKVRAAQKRDRGSGSDGGH